MSRNPGLTCFNAARKENCDMSNNSDDGFFTGMLLGMMLCDGKNSNGNGGCLCVILALLAVPALIAWIAIAV